MDKNQLIKYALYAAGAYLVWKYVISPMLPATTATPATVPVAPAASLVPNTQTNPAAGSTVTNPFAGQTVAGNTTTTQVTGQPPATPPAQQPLPNPTHDPNQKYPRGRLLLASGHAAQLTPDGWNFYYAQVTGVPQSTDLFDPAVGRDELITVDEYLSRRTAAGLEADAWPAAWGGDTTSGIAGLGTLSWAV